LPSDGGERCSDKGDVSARESRTTCSSTAVSGTSSSSKECATAAAAASRHRKNTTDTAVRSARVHVKRWPKKNVKSSVKGRSQSTKSLPQPSDKLPVEIIFTWSSVDITWQVSVLLALPLPFSSIGVWYTVQC